MGVTVQNWRISRLNLHPVFQFGSVMSVGVAKANIVTTKVTRGERSDLREREGERERDVGGCRCRSDRIMKYLLAIHCVKEWDRKSERGCHDLTSLVCTG